MSIDRTQQFGKPMATSTLTSLAILRVTVDNGGDYLEYLRPLVLHVLQQNSTEPVIDETVASAIREEFGLVVPSATVQLVLKRIARKGMIKRDHGQYSVTGDLPATNLLVRQAEARHKIDRVLQELVEYSQDSACPLPNIERAAEAICAFLAEFDVACLRAYLKGTAIPELEGDHRNERVLVGSFVRALHLRGAEGFSDFLTLMQGHMLANALLCPDLDQAPQSFRRVEFYYDTPLILELLHLDTDARHSATTELTSALDRLGGKVSIFAHTRDEVVRVVQYAADRLEGHGSGEERGIILEARRRGTTRSDLLLVVEQIDEMLAESGVEVKQTPRHSTSYQIDEVAFEDLLKEAIHYFNPRARADDVNSVRSIYELRAGNTAASLERAKSVLVTSNASFADAAWQYGQQYESTRAVSSVITNFTLANTAWLKRPLETLNIPRSQLLAAAFALLQPSETLLTRYMSEIERLEREGSFGERDLQLLRSSPSALAEIMYFTLGEDAALSEETLQQTLHRVEAEIRAEDASKIQEVELEHRATQMQLDQQMAGYRVVGERLVNRCATRARRHALALVTTLAALLTGCISSGFWLPFENILGKWLLTSVACVMVGWQLLNMIISSDAVRLYHWLRIWLFRRYLSRGAEEFGFDLADLSVEI